MENHADLIVLEVASIVAMSGDDEVASIARCFVCFFVVMVLVVLLAVTLLLTTYVYVVPSCQTLFTPRPPHCCVMFPRHTKLHSLSLRARPCLPYMLPQ